MGADGTSGGVAIKPPLHWFRRIEVYTMSSALGWVAYPQLGERNEPILVFHPML